MHSVLCDDKRQCGGWNVGLQGPEEGWAYEEQRGWSLGGGDGACAARFNFCIPLERLLSSLPCHSLLLPSLNTRARAAAWAGHRLESPFPPPANPTWHGQSWTGPTLTVDQPRNTRFINTATLLTNSVICYCIDTQNLLQKQCGN